MRMEIIKQLWKERTRLSNQKPITDEDKKHRREHLKIVTDDLFKFLELYSRNKICLRKQELELLELHKRNQKEKRLQHESEIGFVDTDEIDY